MSSSQSPIEREAIISTELVRLLVVEKLTTKLQPLDNVLFGETERNAPVHSAAFTLEFASIAHLGITVSKLVEKIVNHVAGEAFGKEAIVTVGTIVAARAETDAPNDLFAYSIRFPLMIIPIGDDDVAVCAQ